MEKAPPTNGVQGPLPTVAIGTGAVASHRGRVVSFDDDPHPILAPAEPAKVLPPARRKRGRPRKSLTQVAQDTDDITSDDMALLKAHILGVSASRAAQNYVLHEDHNDGRAARGYLHRLYARLRRAAGELRDRQISENYVKELLEPLPPAEKAAATASEQPRAKPAPAVPTLEEFAQRYDPDMYTEKELVELFQDEYGSATPAAQTAPTQGQPPDSAAQRREAAITRKLEILAWLGPRVSITPGPDSPLTAWVGRTLASTLSAEPLRLHTLAQVARWINASGRWWYDQVPGLGRARAARLLTWLARHEEAIGVRLDSRIAKRLLQFSDDDAPPQRAGGAGAHVSASRELANGTTQIYGLVPWQQLLWPAELLGHDGRFRLLNVENTLEATNDLQAVKSWLKNHRDKSPATQEVYERAIERLVLWAIVERRRALSSLSSDDFVDFRDFLYKPPAHWCGREAVMKFSEDWRPLRGGLSEAGVRQVIGAVKSMFKSWRAAGYLYADPTDVLSFRRPQEKKGKDHASEAPPSKPMKLQVNHAFVNEDLQAMKRTLEEMPEGPSRRRLRAILLLLLTAGLRRGEPQRLSWGSIKQLRTEQNNLAEGKQLTVIGKGNKERVLPLKEVTVAALQAHFADRMALVDAGKLPASFKEIPQEDAPLLSVLRHAEHSGRPGRGESVSAASRETNRDGRLDGATIYWILKEFFKVVAVRKDYEHRSEIFKAASTHWMRHSFAHVSFAEGGAGSLATVQALLGHANIETTGGYLEAHMESKMQLIQAIEAVF